MEKVRKIKISFDNTTEEDIVFKVIKKQCSVEIKFLEEFEDMVDIDYNPIVLAPRNRIEIDYKLTIK